MAITLTERAVEHVKGFITGRGNGQGLRLSVKTSGCSGLSYVLEVLEEVKEGDIVFEDQGVKVAVDEKSLTFLDGTELDYTREGLNEGFKFNNPNVAASCGCGESFSV